MGKHDSRREGARLGLVVATSIWLWLAVVAGEPFRTFTVLGGIARFTTMHYPLGLGELAWVRVFGGSLIGTAIAIAILARRHPLAAELRQAEEEDNK